MTRGNMVKDDYTRPCVTDFGSLTQLTNDFDATFHGSVVKLVSLAVASVPVAGGNSGAGGANPDPTGGVLNSSSTSPTGSNLTPSSIDPGSATGHTVSDPRNAALGAESHTPSGTTGSDPGTADPSGTRGAATGHAAGTDPAGTLPFTGYAAMLTAGVGAALAGTGAALRSRVRRRRA